MQNRKQVTVRLDEQVHLELVRLARLEAVRADRSMNWQELLNRAARKYVDETKRALAGA